jgi:hypothetical protein
MRGVVAPRFQRLARFDADDPDLIAIWCDVRLVRDEARHAARHFRHPPRKLGLALKVRVLSKSSAEEGKNHFASQ